MWNFLENLRHPRLKPAFTASDRVEFERGLQAPVFARMHETESRLIGDSHDEKFTVDGYCLPCGQMRPFLVDMTLGGRRTADGWIPNWRERVACPVCGMNNRQRLVAALVDKELQYWPSKNWASKNVWFMEFVTPIFGWTKRTHKRHRIT